MRVKHERFSNFSIELLEARRLFSVAYKVTAINVPTPFPGTDMEAAPAGINAYGDVVIGSSNDEMFIYRQGRLYNLARLTHSGLDGVYYEMGQSPTCINNLDELGVGYFSTAGNFPDVFNLAGVEQVGTANGEINAINDLGIAVGDQTVWPPSATVPTTPLIVNVRTLATSTLAPSGGLTPTLLSAINDSGEIGGAAVTASGDIHAFVDQGGVYTDLGIDSGLGSPVAAINRFGDLIGSGLAGAFLYRNGSILNLGSAFNAEALNDLDEVVGSLALDANSDVTRGCIYRDGKLIDLNSLVPKSAWTIVDANGINDLGEICVTAKNDELGDWRVELLTPFGVNLRDNRGPLTFKPALGIYNLASLTNDIVPGATLSLAMTLRNNGIANFRGSVRVTFALQEGSGSLQQNFNIAKFDVVNLHLTSGGTIVIHHRLTLPLTVSPSTLITVTLSGPNLDPSSDVLTLPLNEL